jgi:ferrochelatase
MRGFLLVNLGTPDSPEVKDVRRYLMEFLSDPLVIDTHPVVRWLIVNLIIAPFRSRKSAALYQKLWTKRGSPLLFHGLDLRDQVAKILGSTWKVELGMRYGSQSIGQAVKTLSDTTDLTVFLLFPQYSAAAFESAKLKVEEEIKLQGYKGSVKILKPYFDHPKFIQVFADLARPHFKDYKKIFFTFHGIPVRHCKNSSPQSNRCSVDKTCCDSLREDNLNCYRAQCFATARAIAKNLGLETYEIVFQSRFGRDPWIQPFADYRLNDIIAEGVESVLYISPSFTADCLETIEEIGEGYRELFLAAKEKKFHLVESLNSRKEWAEAIVDIAQVRS